MPKLDASQTEFYQPEACMNENAIEKGDRDPGSVWRRRSGSLAWPPILLSFVWLFSLTGFGAQPLPLLTTETRLAACGWVSISGDTIAVNNQVFVRGPTGWVVQQTIADSGGAVLDGNTLVVGTNIYGRIGSTWSWQGNLPFPPDYGPMCIAVGGDTIAVGRPYDDTNTWDYTGAVYVFTRTGSTWSLQTRLVANDATPGLGLGASVAVGGNYIVAGGPGVSGGYYGKIPATYVFVRTGSDWVQQAELTDRSGGNYESSHFGESVAISGNTIAIGDSMNNAVSMFVWDNGAWLLQQKLSWSGGLTPGGPYYSPNVPFGLYGDAFAVSDRTGIVHVFGRSAGVWNEQQTIDSGASFRLGPSVGVGTNGIVVDASGSGGAYVYEPQTSTWVAQDIGAVGAAGSSSVSNGLVRISGAGADIGGTADAFRYFYRTWSGNLEAITKVSQISGGDSWARGGIMFRGSLAAGSPHAFMMLTEGSGSGFQDRLIAGANSDYTFGGWSGIPYWLKLVKVGNTVAAYQSADGAAWTNVGTTNINLPDPFYIGLGVTSHQNGTLATVQFEHMDITTSIDAVPQAVSGLTAVAAGVDRVNLSWTDNSISESGFAVKRNGIIVATVAPNTTRFTDTGLSAATTYSYRVQAIAAGGSAPDSNMARATTWKLPDPWQSRDIGAVDIAGDAVYSSSVPPMYGNGITVTGAGTMADPSDSFHYVFQQWTGDLDFRAAAWIQLYSETDAGSKAGLMLRSSLDPSSPYVMMTVTAGLGDKLDVRGSNGHTSELSMPGYWTGTLKLVRQGNTISAYRDQNQGLVLVAQTNIDLGNTIYVGFAVSGHDSGYPVTAYFSQISLLGGTQVCSSIPPTLSATAVSPSEIDLSWTDPNVGHNRYILELWPPNSDSTYVVNWFPSNVTAFADVGLAAGTTRYYRLRTELPDGDWLYSNLAIATTEPATGKLPPPWQNRDVGVVGVGGTATVNESNRVFAVTGSGADIGGSADSFQYAYRPWQGDGYIIAHLNGMVSSVGGLDPAAKFGLMVRQSLEPGAANAFTFFTPQAPPAFQSRSASGSATISVAGVQDLGWIKLARSGNQFSGYVSSDGKTWTSIASASVSMIDPVLIGFALTSHTNTVAASGAFDLLQIGPAQNPAMSLIGRQTYGLVRLTVQSLPGWSNRVDVSPDLIHWMPWSNYFSASGTIVIDDPMTLPQRFYRAAIVR